MAKEKSAKQPAGGGLQKIITEGRERKKVQDTADKIFGNRNLAGKRATNPGISLSNRAGVSKQRGVPSRGLAKPNSLAARSNGCHGATPTGPRADARAERNAQGIADALFSTKPNPVKAQVNIVPNQKNNGNGRNGNTHEGGTQFAGAAARAREQQQGPPSGGGLTIKGLAGPHLVEVRGFAPGTSAADIEEALRSKGISVHSCRILQSSPKVIVDILCNSKEDADRIWEFHQQWTDYDARTNQSFQLFVFAPRPVPMTATSRPQPQPSSNNGVLVDGSMGFEPLSVDYGTSQSALYSDQLVHNNQNHGRRNDKQNNNHMGRGSRGGQGSSNR